MTLASHEQQENRALERRRLALPFAGEEHPRRGSERLKAAGRTGRPLPHIHPEMPSNDSPLQRIRARRALSGRRRGDAMETITCDLHAKFVSNSNAVAKMRSAPGVFVLTKGPI